MHRGRGSYPNVVDDRCLKSIHVKNLPETITYDDVWNGFRKFGTIVNITLPLIYNTNTSKGFAFVEYLDEDEAANALVTTNGSKLWDRTLSISYARGRPKSAREMAMRTALRAVRPPKPDPLVVPESPPPSPTSSVICGVRSRRNRSSSFSSKSSTVRRRRSSGSSRSSSSYSSSNSSRSCTRSRSSTKKSSSYTSSTSHSDSSCSHARSKRRRSRTSSSSAGSSSHCRKRRSHGRKRGRAHRSRKTRRRKRSSKSSHTSAAGNGRNRRSHRYTTRSKRYRRSTSRSSSSSSVLSVHRPNKCTPVSVAAVSDYNDGPRDSNSCARNGILTQVPVAYALSNPIHAPKNRSNSRICSPLSTHSKHDHSDLRPPHPTQTILSEGELTPVNSEEFSENCIDGIDGKQNKEWVSRASSHADCDEAVIPPTAMSEMQTEKKTVFRATDVFNEVLRRTHEELLTDKIAVASSHNYRVLSNVSGGVCFAVSREAYMTELPDSLVVAVNSNYPYEDDFGEKHKWNTTGPNPHTLGEKMELMLRCSRFASSNSSYVSRDSRCSSGSPLVLHRF